MHFQWYPGHMTKARRMMQENIKLIDLIIELVDTHSRHDRNPDIDELRKIRRVNLLNKSDLAEERINDEWIDYFKDRGYSAVKVNSKKGGGMNQIRSAIQSDMRKTERDRKEGTIALSARWLSAFRMSGSLRYQFPRGEGMCEDWE